MPHADAAVENFRKAIGALSAEQAHRAAIQRMAYLFAAVEDTDAFVGKVRALEPAAG